MKQNSSKKQKPIVVTLTMGLEYGPVDNIDYTAPDYVLKLGLIGENVNAGKILEKVRLSLACEIPIEGLFVKDILYKCNVAKNNTSLSSFIQKAVDIQSFMSENYTDSYRKITEEYNPISVNWLDKSTVHKNKLEFLGLCCKSLVGMGSDENTFLELANTMIDIQPDEQPDLIINFLMPIHFRSWGYYLGNSEFASVNNFREFVKHRKAQLKKLILLKPV